MDKFCFSYCTVSVATSVVSIDFGEVQPDFDWFTLCATATRGTRSVYVKGSGSWRRSTDNVGSYHNLAPGPV